MNDARLDDRALIDSLDWEDPTAASEGLARVLDPDGRSLARRDAALLSLHQERFGETLHCAGECPGCGVSVELELPVAQLLPRSVPEVGLTVESDGFVVEFRLPTPDDLASVTDERAFGERCVVAARRLDDGLSVEAVALPDGVLAAMGEAMALLHPAGGLRVDITCAGCSERWNAGLDVTTFVAARARIEALRVLAEVHALAGAYGWTETEVLAVPRARRRRYLELVHS
jgi:hypothetical protein